ncbi:MAG: cytochrome P450 [Sinomonas sp.]|nr:cytochrome P450 [Sinomonas sp.]
MRQARCNDVIHVTGQAEAPPGVHHPRPQPGALARPAAGKEGGMTLTCPFTGATADDGGAPQSVPAPSAAPTLPPYSHELEWPKGLEPFKVVDDGSQGDPYRHYRWMLDNAPVLRASSPVSDVWFISRYDDVRKALRAPKIFSSEVVKPVPLTFLTLIDAPDHARLRQIVAKAFTPKAIGLFEERIRENAEALLDTLVARGGGDVVEDYAIPLSMSTISALLDVPAEDFDKMKFWSDETFSYFGRLARNAPGTGTDEESANAFFAYLKDTMERLYAEGNESVGGHIATMWKEGELTEKEAKELCAFVFIAGHDTTTILLANAFRVISEQPALLDSLNGEPSDAEPFVEELARFRGTVQRVSRITTEDVEVAGVTLPRGAIVRLMPAAANHDAAKYPNPDVFDIDRDTGGHLGFGHGVHSCLGAPLARLETKVTAELLGRRLASVRFDPDHEIEYVRGNNLTNSGPHRLVVLVEGRE